MEEEEIKNLIKQGIPDAEITITGDGHHFDAVIVSGEFANLNSVKRQQMVYATVAEQISSGKLHALSLKTFTKEEWVEQNG